MQSMLPIASSLARSLVTIHAITCTIIYDSLAASSSNKLIRALSSETSYALLIAAVGSSMHALAVHFVHVFPEVEQLHILP